jgi:hypothetical protein
LRAAADIHAVTPLLASRLGMDARIKFRVRLTWLAGDDSDSTTLRMPSTLSPAILLTAL